MSAAARYGRRLAEADAKPIPARRLLLREALIFAVTFHHESKHAGEEEKYTLVLANPPFGGSLDYENCAKDLQQIVKTKKPELLFLALFLRLLKPGGRAVIVPDGVILGSSNASL
jgi:type I restriction-modification system DNA methylase subunit